MDYLKELEKSDEFDYWNGASSEDIEKAEHLLDVGFPDNYKEFLKQCGMCSYGDTIILGIVKTDDEVSFPIVEATLEMRGALDLDKKYLLIQYESAEYLSLYNLKDNKIYQADLFYDANQNLGLKNIELSFESFEEFFEDFILLGSEED